MINIKQCVKENVEFRYYRDGCLWYQTVNDDLFPVPIEDIGNAVFFRNDKGILFMRYMRQWNKAIDKETKQ